jgi:hypothetical protein
MDSSQKVEQQPRISKTSTWSTRITIFGLSVTTTFSGLLLVTTVNSWTFPSATYKWIALNRATAQLIIQLLSNALALTQVSVLTFLINHASRLVWNRRPVSADVVRFWHGLCVRCIHWSSPLLLLLPLIVFVTLTATPSAIWAGALTPVATTINSETTIALPAYTNATNIKEWPSEIGQQGPIVRSPKGLFSFSPGIQMQGNLLASASSATTVDGSVRQHIKLDNSQFIYIGRSFGVGSSVGLLDDSGLMSDYAVGYTYQEVGYETSVSCIYNLSAEFAIHEGPRSTLWVAEGLLPNSGIGEPEESTYFGHGSSAIVAIGVGRNATNPRRMLGIAAGESYDNLDRTQCSMDFVPTLFNVSVAISGRNITVNPVQRVHEFKDGGNLTQTLMRQFELISNDQTNLYVSLVGNSFNDSISNYMIAHNGSSELSLRQATLSGLENALTAMLDDMLVAYASAQVMIQKDTTTTEVMLKSGALRVGEYKYIFAIFVINTIIVLLLAVEAARTRLWADMPPLDYMDPAALMIASTNHGDEDIEPRNKSPGSPRAVLLYGSNVVLDWHKPPITHQ